MTLTGRLTMKLLLSALLATALVLVPTTSEAKRPAKGCTTTVVASLTSHGPSTVTRYASCPIRSRR